MELHHDIARFREQILFPFFVVKDEFSYRIILVFNSNELRREIQSSMQFQAIDILQQKDVPICFLSSKHSAN